jgi:predicted Zn-dependent protease
MKPFYYFFCVVLFLMGCNTNAITGRKQLHLFPESSLQQQAIVEYRSFLQQNNVVATSNSNAAMVKRVGGKLATAIKKYYASRPKPVNLNNYQWEFNLVQDTQVNAWCMPGGKVVVYTGLLAITQNEAALAVVLAHEITHALAQHGNERMSQMSIAQGLQVAGNAFTEGNSQLNSIFNNVYGPGATVAVLLPNSRKQELEADRFGLIFTAMAGYNPREAIPFWQRMESESVGSKPPEFLSSHPSDANRIAQINKYLPEALKYYKSSR